MEAALTVWAFSMLTYVIVFPDVAFRINMKLTKRFNGDLPKRQKEGA